jgi:hypothetical protein
VTEEYTGKSFYLPDYQHGPYQLLVAVLCRVGGFPSHALLDTGSQWCLLPVSLVIGLGYDVTPDPDTPPLHTRFGTFAGRLERIPVTFDVNVGTTATVEATFFVSADWSGPMVIGWKGCLERMRFGLNPAEEAFLFAEL